MAQIRCVRPQAEPNAGFRQQLELYLSESCQVRLASPRVRRYLLQHTFAMGDYITPVMLATQDDPYSDAVPDTPASTSARLRCKMCRRELAKDTDVVQHEPGKGELAFEPHKRDSVRRGQDTAPVARQKGPLSGLERMQRVLGQRRGLLHSPACSAYFVEPQLWMTESSDVVVGVVSGRLVCPNTHCHAKLGSWTWAGTQCAWYVLATNIQRRMGNPCLCTPACES